jgi:hypothetical protein
MAFTEVVNILFRSKGAGKVKRDVRGIKSGLQGAAKAARALAGPILGLAGAAALTRLAKQTMDFRKGLTQLAIQGHITAGEQANLEQKMLDTSVATGVARDKLLEYGQSVTDATGNLTFAAAAMEEVSIAAQVTGAEMLGLGDLAADAFLKFGIGADGMGDALAVLIEQGEMGRLTLKEMGESAPKLFSTAALAGLATGEEGLRELGAVAQVVRQGFSEGREAATGMLTMVSSLAKPETAKKLDELGVKLRDPKTKEMRKFTDVFLETLGATGGDIQELMGIFGVRGILGVTEFRKQFKIAGGDISGVRAALDKFMNVSGKASNTHAKFARVSNTAAVQTEKFKARMTELITETLLTESSMNALGAALGNMASSLEWAVGLVQGFGEQLAKWFGVKEGTGLAKLSRGQTTEQLEARRAMNLVMLKGDKPGLAMSPGERAAIEWFKGSKFAGGGLKGTPGVGGLARKQLQRNLDDPETFEKIAKAYAQEIKLDVTVNNAAGATVEASQKGKGKIKTTGGASAGA